MRVLIMGIDGYIGWPLALRLLREGHEVTGIDNFYTRRRVREVHSESALPIGSMEKRIAEASEMGIGNIGFFRGDVSDSEKMHEVIKATEPEAVVHLAEQRSAPYSMIGLRQAKETMVKNIVSTINLIYEIKDQVPDCHILKLGTMGEYGTPNIDIPEGFFDIEYRGRKDHLPFPKNAGSWYHWTKVHDSNNLMFANRVWKLSVTDVMQGVVYGTRTEDISDPALYTRFDTDEVWGTALNRFCAQAVAGLPITPYGKGNQARGFLSLEDSVSCLALGIKKPPAKGEYRVYNQFDEYYTVNHLAETVQQVYQEDTGKSAEIRHVENPRVELEDHYYNPENHKLKDLGYRRKRELRQEISIILKDLEKYRNRILKHRDSIMPKTIWKA